MPFAVEAVVVAFGDSIAEGNIYLLNDPYRGKTGTPGCHFRQRDRNSHTCAGIRLPPTLSSTR
jgi:hypothetical protein